MSSANPTPKPINSEGNGSQVMNLMRSMGATKWDPIPPEQYLFFLNSDDPVQRLLAWVRSKTIRHGHRSPYCIDDQGRELSFRHLAADLDWDAGGVRRAWRDAEAMGLVKKEGRRLMLRGDVPAPGPRLAKKKRSEVCTDLFPPYLLGKINRLPQERKAALITLYEREHNFERTVLKEAVAGVRSIFDQRKHTLLCEFGVKKIEGKKQRPAESELVPVLLNFVQKSVQTALRPVFAHGDRSVQTHNGPVYSEESRSAQTRPSLLTLEKKKTAEEEQQQQPLSRERRAAAAAASRTSASGTNAGGETPTNGQRSAIKAAWPLTLARAREYYPDTGEPFLGRLVAACLPVRPHLTDAELATCLVKTKRQDTAALFYVTAPERVEALNAADGADAVREHHGRISMEELERETAEMVQRKLSNPALPKVERQLLERDFPDLVAAFVTRDR